MPLPSDTPTTTVTPDTRIADLTVGQLQEVLSGLLFNTRATGVHHWHQKGYDPEPVPKPKEVVVPQTLFMASPRPLLKPVQFHLMTTTPVPAPEGSKPKKLKVSCKQVFVPAPDGALLPLNENELVYEDLVNRTGMASAENASIEATEI